MTPTVLNVFTWPTLLEDLWALHFPKNSSGILWSLLPASEEFCQVSIVFSPCTLYAAAASHLALPVNKVENTLDVIIGLHRLKFLLEFLTAFYLHRIRIYVTKGHNGEMDKMKQ